jgi:hypothetical protein
VSQLDSGLSIPSGQSTPRFATWPRNSRASPSRVARSTGITPASRLPVSVSRQVGMVPVGIVGSGSALGITVIGHSGEGGSTRDVTESGAVEFSAGTTQKTPGCH